MLGDYYGQYAQAASVPHLAPPSPPIDSRPRRAVERAHAGTSSGLPGRRTCCRRISPPVTSIDTAQPAWGKPVRKFVALALDPLGCPAACCCGGYTTPPALPTLPAMIRHSGAAQRRDHHGRRRAPAAAFIAVNTRFDQTSRSRPGTTTCPTIDHIEIDTLNRAAASPMRRSPSAAAGSNIYRETDGLNACIRPTGTSFGSLCGGDIQLPLSGETATGRHRPDHRYTTSPPSRRLRPGTTTENTWLAFAANGILGVGPFIDDLQQPGNCPNPDPLTHIRYLLQLVAYRAPARMRRLRHASRLPYPGWILSLGGQHALSSLPGWRRHVPTPAINLSRFALFQRWLCALARPAKLPELSRVFRPRFWPDEIEMGGPVMSSAAPMSGNPVLSALTGSKTLPHALSPPRLPWWRSTSCQRTPPMPM